MSFVTSQRAEFQKWCNPGHAGLKCLFSGVFTDCRETQKTLLIGISRDLETTSALCFGLHGDGVMSPQSTVGR